MRRSIVATILALLCAGCGGSGAGLTVPGSSNAQGVAAERASRPTGAAVQGAAAPSEKRLKERVRVTIRIPKRAKRHGRAPAYVSPATASLRLKVMQGETTFVDEIVALTPDSTGCIGVQTATNCSVTLSLPVGSYTASISTYDGPGGTGNVLSTAQAVAFTVAAGTNNAVPLTLSGVPASFLVTAAGSTAVYVLALDADGNVIVGAGAPVLTASLTSGTAVVAISQPAPAAPNKISFAPATPPVNGSETIGITASYPTGQTNGCLQTGAVCSLPSAISARYGQTLFVSNAVGDDILGYSVPFTSSTPTAIEQLPLHNALAFALDANEDVFAANNSTSGELSEFEPPYNGASVTNGSGVDDAYGVCVTPSGDVFVANEGNSTVSEYAPPYTATPASITLDVSSPYACATDSNSNLYVANQGNATLTEYAAPNYSTVVKLSTSSTPYSLAISGSTLYVGESADIDAFALPLTGASTSKTVSHGISDVQSIAFDSSGNLYAANYGTDTVTQFATPLVNGATPTVTISESAVAPKTYAPFGLAFDAAGNLYVVNNDGGSLQGGVNEYQPPFTNASVPAFSVATNDFDFADVGLITKPTLTISP